MSLMLFHPILTETLLILLGLIVLGIDLTLPKGKHRLLGWVTAFGMGLIIPLSLIARPGEQGILAFGGMVSQDWLSFTFKILFLFGAGLTALLAMDYGELGSRGEFYILLIASTIGMSFAASSADLIMLYLSIEMISIPLYVLAGFFVNDKKSVESGFKYLFFGALTSAILLYGFSLLYGLAGTTNILHIVTAIMQGVRQGIAPAFVGALMMVLIGVGFKIAVVPVHFWAPDVYEGSPTPVAGFLSTASKAAGFIVLIRLLFFVFPADLWSPVLASLSAVTMTLGNLVALTQRNIKRMLAYSSIAHAGYALIGVVAGSALGLTSVVYYMLSYVVTNLAAFGVVSVYGQAAGSDDLTAYHGMSRRSPGLALAFLVALLSLAGMPPLSGFIAKLFIFMAAVQNPRWIWLAVVGALNSIIGLYYYLTVLKYVYLYRSEDDEKPVPVTRSFKVAMAVLIAGILLIGTLFSPWFSWATKAASAMFS